jgi:uncharacterized protein YqeY
MNLLQKIESGMKESLKSGDKIRSDTLKMLKSDMMYEKAKTGQDISEEQMDEVIKRAAKRRKEAIKEYNAAGRKDLADKEALELKIIEEFMPEQMSEEQILAVVERIISEAGAVTEKEMGKVMGLAMKELKGKADGNIVRQIMQRKLGGK